MSGFFSANVTSPFPDQNALFDAAKVANAGQAYQNNQLLMQGRQLDLTAADHEQVGRLAAGLLNEPDLAKRADLYARGVGALQSQNLAKYAPPTLPDEGVLRSLVSQAIPAADQYKLNLGQGAVNSAITALAPNQTSSAAPTTTTPGTAPTGAGTATIGQRQNNPGNLTFAGQPGASPGQGNRFASFPDMPSGVAATADQLAIYQQQHGINTVRGAVTRWVGDPKADLGSYIGDVSKAIGVGPDDKIDLTDPAVQAKFIQAQFPHESAGGGYVLNPADVAKGVQMAAANRGRAVQAPGTAIATAAQPGATPPPTQYAGPGAPRAPTLPPAATETPPGPAQPPGATAAPAQPGQPQGPAATAQAPPTPASVQPTAAPPAVPHLVTPSGQAVPPPPGGVEVLSNGLTPQQWGLVQSELKAASMGGPGAIAGVLEKVPALVAANRALNMQAWQAANPALKTQETSTGSILINPRTGQVVGSIAYQPNMQSRAVEGSATWDGSKWIPAVPGQPSVPGKWVYAGASRGDFQPEANIPAQASYKVAESQYDRDSKEIAGIADAGRMAQADQIRINEMQDVLQRFSSGPGTDARTAAASFLQRWLPASITGWEKQSANLSGAEAAQAFSKLALAGAGSAERSVLGNRGGFQAIKMFQAANPNVDLQDATNKSILDMQLISNQANQDYSQAAQRHFAQNETTFGGPTHQYTSLAQFDTNWNAQRGPQVYAAAMGAIGGQPSSQWAKGLSDDEYARALQIVQRAKPSAVVQTKNGPYSMQPNAVTTGTSAAPGTKVIRFDHNGNQIQ